MDNKNMKGKELKEKELEQISGGRDDDFDTKFKHKVGDIVKLKPTATMADGRIISCVEKQKQYKIVSIDKSTGTVSLEEIGDRGWDELVVRYRDIEVG